MAAAFLFVAAVSAWVHGPLADSCEPTCSPEYLVHGNFRVPASSSLLYADAVLVVPLAGIAAIVALLWKPVSRGPGAILLITLAILVTLDSWFMRYW
jgi:hypothetical protein